VAKRPTAYACPGSGIPDIWVVGYGLDPADMFRTPRIAALKREGANPNEAEIIDSKKITISRKEQDYPIGLLTHNYERIK